ncbi:pentapeptide repeat-containing protein [Nonomuraea jabiensis]|uniref:pentapeptide repeat-containing protein n=1 Tax=Nonomuraea jabiensis TaxID=882448 RepID=UPI003D72DD49
MKLLSIVVAIVTAVLVVAIGLMLGPGASWWLEHVDGVTGLTGKDLAAAVDAVRGRALAVATGLAALIAIYYTARNADTARRAFQLSERGHDTDRYGKAADQLGHDKAHVRLAGLYAFEQLAQDNVALRQTTVNVLSAYLRMPWPLPKNDQEASSSETDEANPAHRNRRHLQEELQVRLAAQRILAAHLRCPPVTRRHWWERAAAPPSQFWSGIQLDLTDALLIDLDFRDCRAGDASFRGATFTGNTMFGGTTFTGETSFDGVAFNGPVSFRKAAFSGNAMFNGAIFSSDAVFEEIVIAEGARFDGAAFAGSAWFAQSVFHEPASFEKATFHDQASFEKAVFNSGAMFDGATFSRNTTFGGTTFKGYALFGRATLRGSTSFAKATFNARTHFDGAAFKLDASFSDATFGDDATFSRATFGRDAVFAQATFSRKALFHQTVFSGHASFARCRLGQDAEVDGATVTAEALGVEHEWPPNWSVQPDGKGGGFLRRDVAHTDTRT